MDSALILLLRLRFWGWFRRMGRGLGTARGLLMTLVGVAFLSMMVVPSMLAPMPTQIATAQAEGFRRFGPFFFLLYCILILLLSPGEKAFAFSPAEVSFLFPGPFTRRKLLAYKIGGNLALTVLSGFFFMFALRSYWTKWYAGYVGVIMAFAFLQLFQIMVTVIGQAIGAAATTWRRRLAIGLILALAGGVAFTLGMKAMQSFDLETLKRLENAPITRAAKMPFRPFVETIGATRLWPDLIGWGTLALAINASLIALVLAADAQYLEAAAATSERFYAKLERMRAGGPSFNSLGKKKTWKGIPSLPWMGGIGPILWRQLSGAGRDYARALAPVLTSLGLAVFAIVIVTFGNGNDRAAAGGFGAAIVALSIAISNIVTFDFRGDFDRMEGLKTLPIRPSRIVLGQIATPWVLMTGSQLLALAILAIGTWPVPPPFWAYLIFAAPLNFLLLEIENLMFLWFPSRPMVHTPGDVQAMGRYMVQMFGKMLILAITAGLAGLFGFLAYLVGGIIAAGVAAWLVMLGIIVLFVPVLAMAFNRFDVASDTPA